MRNFIKEIFKQFCQDMHDTKIILQQLLKDKSLPVSDLDDEVEQQRENHILRMLRAQLLRDLQNDHEPDEISSAMHSYKKILKSKAKLLADCRFSEWNLKNVSKSIKTKQEKDEIIETSKRINENLVSKLDFIYRLFGYSLVISTTAIIAFLMIGK